MSPGHTRVPHDARPAAREVLNRVGDKWSVFVVMLLSEGPRRFSEPRQDARTGFDARAARARGKPAPAARAG